MQEKKFSRLFNFKVILCDTSVVIILLQTIVAGQAKFNKIKDIYLNRKSRLHSRICLDIEGGCKVERHGGAKAKVTEDVS